jgi:hypothetical protein
VPQVNTLTLQTPHGFNLGTSVITDLPDDPDAGIGSGNGTYVQSGNRSQILGRLQCKRAC